MTLLLPGILEPVDDFPGSVLLSEALETGFFSTSTPSRWLEKLDRELVFKAAEGLPISDVRFDENFEEPSLLL